MRRPTFFADADVLRASNSQIVITGSEAHHAVTVTRIAIDEHIDLVDGNGVRAHVVVKEISSKDSFACEVLEKVQEAQPPLRISAVQALIKDSELAVDLLTQSGVHSIIPWSAERCVVRWRGDRSSKSQGKWQLEANQASKQCRRAWWPTVAEVVNTTELVERLRAFDLVLVLDDESGIQLKNLTMPVSGNVALIIGPEGGLSPTELDRFAHVHAQRVSLGDQIWRSSSAGSAALITIAARS